MELDGDSYSLPACGVRIQHPFMLILRALKFKRPLVSDGMSPRDGHPLHQVGIDPSLL
jgi:hypothetical protein